MYQVLEDQTFDSSIPFPGFSLLPACGPSEDFSLVILEFYKYLELCLGNTHRQICPPMRKNVYMQMYIFKDVCTVAHPSQDIDDGPFGNRFTLMHDDEMKKRSNLIV